MKARELNKLAVLRICTTEIMENCRSHARLMMKMAIGMATCGDGCDGNLSISSSA
jgi:hypothetical protein